MKCENVLGMFLSRFMIIVMYHDLSANTYGRPNAASATASSISDAAPLSYLSRKVGPKLGPAQKEVGKFLIEAP